MTDNQLDPNSLEKEAKDLYQAGKFPQAAELFEQAASLFDTLGNPSLAAEMRNNQSVSLLKARKPKKAYQAVLGTWEIFDQSGDQLKKGMALANEATALKDLGKKDQAIDMFTEALQVFQDLGESELILQTSQSLSSLKLQTRNLPGALFSMQEGLEKIEKPNLRQKFLLKLLNIPSRLLDN
jgi:tetratricopeptide (TPR) repeat protein